MQLFNSLTHKIEEFQPLKDGQVSFYACGPTVYDYQTIGNLRTYLFYDSLHRALRLSGYDVEFVMNITDVGHLTSDADEGEDKLEAGATRANKTVWEVAEYFIDSFKRNITEVNIILPKLVRATDFIEQQIQMIEILLKKGYAYKTDSAIYFDVTKLSSYGELTGQKLAEKLVGARSEVITDKHKRHPQDFALWFFRVGRFADHQMHWSSPWGDGFPGWHLECSAIIHANLDDPIDIHAGGVDLIGTHHTNEMAQTEAAYGHKLARYWLHGEHLLVDGQRMGKSLGNFYTLEDVKKKGFDPLALRLLFLQAHYRNQLNFTWDSLTAAQKALNELYAWADLTNQALNEKVDSEDLLKLVKTAVQKDLNTAQALAHINKVSQQKPSEDLLLSLDNLLGLELSARLDISAEQKKLIESREAARKKQNWPEADALRQKLEEHGLEIDDTPNGPIWSRIAKS